MPGFSLPGCELGVATAATQIEGGAIDTTWHRWAGADRIADHSTPARAADHANRVEQDIALLGELGVRHYRMGLEWARIEPLRGQFDPVGLAHYRDELTQLRDAGIRPLVTLHHFSEPGWFADAGGWLAPDAVPTFLRYVDAVVGGLGDLVTDWITINEPTVYTSHAYLWGLWPPGETSAYRHALAATQALVDAHLAAYPLIHRLRPDARVGVAHHLRAFRPRNPRNPAHRGAATLSRYLFQGALVEMMATARGRLPLRRPKGAVPGRYYDFHAINYYTRSTVAGLADGTAAQAPVNDLGWEIYPHGLVEVAQWVHDRWPGPIWISENGVADRADAFRSRFLYDHLAQIAASDLPIERYYHWCFTDNFEWAEGEGARFGLVELDYATQARTVRGSGRFYADIIANHGVTEVAYQRWVAGQEYPTNGEGG